MEEAKLKAAEQEKNDKAEETGKDTTISKPEGAKATQPLKKATSSSEQDLDVFLLGDLGDSDDGPGAFSTSTVFEMPLFAAILHMYFCGLWTLYSSYLLL